MLSSLFLSPRNALFFSILGRKKMRTNLDHLPTCERYKTLFAFYYVLVFLFLSGCFSYGITTKREIIDRDTLASTFIESPDPRQLDPPHGEEITFFWNLPSFSKEDSPSLVLTFLYRNYQKHIYRHPITNRKGSFAFSLLDPMYRETKGILTYRAQVVTKQGKVLATWQHQLWFHPIEVNGKELFPQKKVEQI